MFTKDIANTGKGFFQTFARLSALEARTEDALENQKRIEAKIDSLIERVTRLEAESKYFRESLKNAIMAEIVREVTQAQVYMGLQSKGLLPTNYPNNSSETSPKRTQKRGTL